MILEEESRHKQERLSVAMATSQPGLPEPEIEGLLQRKNELDEGGRKVREGGEERGGREERGGEERKVRKKEEERRHGKGNNEGKVWKRGGGGEERGREREKREGGWGRQGRFFELKNVYMYGCRSDHYQ